jgi:hypothetical protein
LSDARALILQHKKRKKQKQTKNKSSFIYPSSSSSSFLKFITAGAPEHLILFDDEATLGAAKDEVAMLPFSNDEEEVFGERSKI